MKILHITPYISQMYGGPSIAVQNIAEILRNDVNRIDILTTNSGLVENANFKNEFKDFLNSKIYIFKTEFPKTWFYSSQLKKWLKINGKKYDLFHLHIPLSWPNYVAAKYAKKMKIPYIVSPHGVFDKWSMNQKKIKKLIYLYVFGKNILNNAEFIHDTSKLEENNLTNLVSLKKIATFPLTLNLFKKNKKPYLQNKNKKLNILYLSRLHPVKGIDYLFNLLKVMSNDGFKYVLNIAGSGDHKYETHLKKQAHLKGINDKIIWHGHVNGKKKESLFVNADIFILLSKHENLGISVLEALSFGVPVIVSDQVAISDEIKSFKAGYVLPLNSFNMLDKNLKKFFEKNKLKLYSKNALKLVNKRYNPEIFKNNLLSLYNKIVN